MTKCSACTETFVTNDYGSLSRHYYKLSEQNDVAHVMWLNRFITNMKISERELVESLRDYFDLHGEKISEWMRAKFIEKFFGTKPHPFVTALQHPTRATLLGYVVEHQHFLRQWVKSCAYIVAKTDMVDATLYELDNINTEFVGYGSEGPSHYELLLRMGESLGLDRTTILETPPLSDTSIAIKTWDQIARDSHWVETMAAMHGLELIADRTLVSEGAKATYFDPSILRKESNEVTDATKNFLREGYEADAGHSKEALDLVDKYSSRFSNTENVQATFARSIDLFQNYLMARLERAEQFTE